MKHSSNDFSAATEADEAFLCEVRDPSQREYARNALSKTASLSERKAMRRRCRRAIEKGRSIIDALGDSSVTHAPSKPVALAVARWQAAPSDNNLHELTRTIDVLVGDNGLNWFCAEVHALGRARVDLCANVITRCLVQRGCDRLVHATREMLQDRQMRLHVRHRELTSLACRLRVQRRARLNREYRSLVDATRQRLRHRKTKLERLGRILVSTTTAALEEGSRRLGEVEQRLREAWLSLPIGIMQRLGESTPRTSFPCELGPEDHDLIRKWHGYKPRGDDRERLEWARKGEKAALRYFETFGRAVRDVSVQQLHEKDGGDWRLADLRVDGRFLDVKNIRCGRRDRFGDHLWNRHKRTQGGDEIDIVGTVAILSAGESIGGLDPTSDCPSEGGSLVLGTVCRSEVSRLGRTMLRLAEALDLDINVEGYRIGGNQWRARVPGWMFEYPDDYYSRMPNWSLLLRTSRRVTAFFGIPILPWVMSNVAVRGGLERRGNETEIIGALRELVDDLEGGLSRRSLFLFVVAWMFAHVGNADAKQELETHLFLDGDGGRSYPLGMHDPREYVWNLMDALDSLFKNKPDLSDRLTRLQLVGVNILRGEVDGERQTVLAYCGNCGLWPLLLGVCNVCPCKERRLVCHGCHHCGYEKCAGQTYGDRAEAIEAAKVYPHWVVRGCTLLPPGPNSEADMQDYEELARRYRVG